MSYRHCTFINNKIAFLGDNQFDNWKSVDDNLQGTLHNIIVLRLMRFKDNVVIMSHLVLAVNCTICYPWCFCLFFFILLSLLLPAMDLGRMMSLLIQRSILKRHASQNVWNHCLNIRPVLKESKAMNLGTSIVPDNISIIGLVLTNVWRQNCLQKPSDEELIFSHLLSLFILEKLFSVQLRLFPGQDMPV